MKKQLTRAVMAGAIGGVFAGNAWAAGFQLQNQTGSGNGNAFAGAAATAEDAGTIFFNPAGMAMLPEGHSLSVAGTVLSRSVNFSDTGTTGVPAVVSTSSNGKNAGGASLIPAFYWSYAIDPATRVGIGVSPTFGNKTDYGFEFVGRNAGYFAEIKQTNINPSVAFKATDSLSVGLGVNYATNETHFKQGVPASTVSNFDIKGDASAWGYNLGLMYNMAPETRLAVTYRSEIQFKLDGYFDVVPTPQVEYLVRSSLTTPAQASMAIAHKLDDKTELLADLTWTGWGVIKNLDLVNKANNQPVTSLSYNFKDTWRVGIGANHQYNDAWKFRLGTAWDQSPVKSEADRTITLPDSNRIWLAFGAKYKVDNRSSIDFGYAHIFFADASTNRAVRDPSNPTQIVQYVRGRWNNSADLLSVQWNYNF